MKSLKPSTKACALIQFLSLNEEETLSYQNNLAFADKDLSIFVDEQDKCGFSLSRLVEQKHSKTKA